MKTDVHLQRDVLDELDWEPSIDASQIGVIAKDGVVTLTGHVPIYAEKHLAEQMAKRVHGVKAVANEIQVRPSDLHVRDDAELAAAAVHALEWDAHVPSQNVRVTVDQGWVTLEGTVERQYQRAAAERAIHHLVGARGVTNEIQVQPPEVTSQIKRDIELALRRNAMINTRRVEVEAQDRMVTLIGDVHTYAESDEAERIAWGARGVDRVVNCLTITPWGDGPAEEWGY